MRRVGFGPPWLSVCRRTLPVTHVIDTTLTRRRVLIGGTTLAVGATGLALATQEAGAQADISLGELAIERAEFAPEDKEVFSPWLLITGDWEYQVQTDPAEWEAYLLVYDSGGNSEAVGITSGETTQRQATGTYGLRGAISAASFYGPSDFAVPDGDDSISVSIPVEVAFVVRDPDGGMLVQARVADDAVVTVTSEGETMANLSGAGTIVAQDDSDDPTPTPPEP